MYKDLKKEVHQGFTKTHSDCINNTITMTFENGIVKPFWNFVKSQKKHAGRVPPLKSQGTLHISSDDKAENLTEQFSSIFTRDTQHPASEMPGAPFATAPACV